VLIAAGRLVAEGLSPREAARAAVAGPLTDDSTVTSELVEMINVYCALWSVFRAPGIFQRTAS